MGVSRIILLFFYPLSRTQPLAWTPEISVDSGMSSHLVLYRAPYWSHIPQSEPGVWDPVPLAYAHRHPKGNRLLVHLKRHMLFWQSRWNRTLPCPSRATGFTYSISANSHNKPYGIGTITVGPMSQRKPELREVVRLAERHPSHRCLCQDVNSGSLSPKCLLFLLLDSVSNL